MVTKGGGLIDEVIKYILTIFMTQSLLSGGYYTNKVLSLYALLVTFTCYV